MSGGASAEVGAGDQLTLDELLTEALRRNPEILAMQRRYEAARRTPASASSLPDPMVSAGYTSSGSPRPVAGLGTEPVANAGLMITQEVPFPGKRKLRGDIASKEAEAEFHRYQQAQLSVVARVKESYCRLHHAYVMGGILESSRDHLRSLLEVTEARYSVGKAAQQDVFKAQSQLTIIETRIARLHQEAQIREAEINSLLNRAPDSRLARPAPLKTEELKMSLEQLISLAVESSPVLMREQRMVEREELSLNLARKDYYPDYSLSGGYFSMGRMPDMYEFRVSVNLPVYFWRKQRNEVAARKHLVGEAKSNFETAGQSLIYRVKTDYLMAETSYRLMNMYRRTIVPQAALALESSLPAYQTGQVDFLTLLNNWLAAIDLELNGEEEELNYHLALVRLEEMTGTRLLEQ